MPPKTPSSVDGASNEGSLCSTNDSPTPSMTNNNNNNSNSNNNNNNNGVAGGVLIESQEPEREIPQRIRDFAAANGYPIVQKNGQRKYGPPDDLKDFVPPFGTEVFIGKLPRDSYEDELVPIFAKIGRVYRFRVMLDFSGSSRGYAFCRYLTKEDANRAVAELNNYEIRRGRHIGLAISVDNCRLFAGGIPRTKTRDEVYEAFNSLTEGVVNVILYPSANDKTKNRGFAFIEYSDHQTCTEARRKLLPSRVMLWGTIIAVDWAEPEANPSDEIMSKVQILYVRNLMATTTEKAIEDAFTEAVAGYETELKPVTRVKKIRDYAFVHFATRQLTEIAREKMNGELLDGAVLEVVFAKPQDKNFSRYIKDVVRMGSNALPNEGNVHQNIVAAAGHLMAANTVPSIAATFHQSPMITAPGLTTALTTGQNTSLYAGFPFIDPNAGGPSENTFNTRLANYRGRGSAGMRAAGFQQSLTNAARRTRRKYSEQILFNDILTPVMSAGAPQANNGLVLLPPFAPLTFPLAPVRSPYAPYLQSPVSPLTPNVVHYKGYCQTLEDYCKRNNYSPPIYEQTVSTTKDGAGRDIPLFVYKITIPELVTRFGHFQPQVSMPDQEDARENAASFALLTLGISPISPVLSQPGPGIPQFIYPSLNPQGFVPFVMPDLSALYASQYQLPQLTNRQTNGSP